MCWSTHRRRGSIGRARLLYGLQSCHMPESPKGDGIQEGKCVMGHNAVKGQNIFGQILRKNLAREREKNSLSVFDDGRLAKKFWKYGYVAMPAEETFVRNALDI